MIVPSAERMPESIKDRAVTKNIRDKMLAGALPSEAPRGVWAGMGGGRKCAACDEAIVAARTQIELEMRDGRLVGALHRECYELWLAELYTSVAFPRAASTGAVFARGLHDEVPGHSALRRLSPS